jgi:hypothetical protein
MTQARLTRISTFVTIRRWVGTGGDIFNLKNTGYGTGTYVLNFLRLPVIHLPTPFNSKFGSKTASGQNQKGMATLAIPFCLAQASTKVGCVTSDTNRALFNNVTRQKSQHTHLLSS